MPIPENYQAFCRDLVKLARKYGVRQIRTDFMPGFDSEWKEQIRMRWHEGRHGDHGPITVESAQYVELPEIQELKSQQPRALYDLPDGADLADQDWTTPGFFKRKEEQP